MLPAGNWRIEIWILIIIMFLYVSTGSSDDVTISGKCNDSRDLILHRPPTQNSLE